MKIPVLSYHSHNVAGNAYENNDHVALYHDLRTLHGNGFHIVPASWVVDWVLGERDDTALEKAVAITFDDGPALDFHDLEYPAHGMQRSFYNILRDFQAEHGEAAQPDLHATSFVIASPQVRDDLDQRSLFGKNWLHSEWWRAAEDSGLISIHNHSWDHNHPDASLVCQKDQHKGSFFPIDSYEECRAEVQQAAEAIHEVIAPAWPDLFAYPWGQSSDYLRDTYFPDHAPQHRTRAAFTTDGQYVTRSTSRWNLSRFVCGSADMGWKTHAGFLRLLEAAGGEATEPPGA